MVLPNYNYYELYEPVHVYIMSIPCPLCGLKKDVSVPAEGLFAYRQGALMQNAFPDMTPEVRDQLMSGVCVTCQTPVGTIKSEDWDADNTLKLLSDLRSALQTLQEDHVPASYLAQVVPGNAGQILFDIGALTEEWIEKHQSFMKDRE